jgi:uncharacterized protein involved in response to NO
MTARGGTRVEIGAAQDGSKATPGAGRIAAGGATPERGGVPYRFSLFAYGFRPFFLLAALWAMVGVGGWMAALHVGWPEGALPPMLWHAHEMLFGFLVAAIAGFLLTAVPSWTGRRGYAGWPLAGLVGLWLAGRVAMSPLTGDHAAAAVVDLLFLPVLALVLAPALVRSGAKRNTVFLLFLGLLFLANLGFHAPTLGLGMGWLADPLGLARDVVLLLVVVIGGRVVPAFTGNALRAAGEEPGIRPRAGLDRAAIAAVALLVLAHQIVPGGTLAGVVALLASGLHGVRMAGWQGLRTLREPLVWVLHLAYLWVVVGLLLRGLHGVAGLALAAGWSHALTIGAFGTMVLAVMSRAALGHTGRPLRAPAPMVVAYLLVSAAVLARVFVPSLAPGLAVPSLGLAAALWIAGFALFAAIFLPILAGPRVDGRPG